MYLFRNLLCADINTAGSEFNIAPWQPKRLIRSSGVAPKTAAICLAENLQSAEPQRGRSGIRRNFRNFSRNFRKIRWNFGNKTWHFFRFLAACYAPPPKIEKNALKRRTSHFSRYLGDSGSRFLSRGILNACVNRIQGGVG